MVNLKKLSALLIALNFLFTGALHAATLDGQPPPFGSSAAEIRADDALEKAELYKRAPVRSVTITNPVNANAIVAVSANVPVTALVDGLEVGFVAGATITGAATFQLDSTAATAITDIAGTALATGNITSGVQYKIRYVAATSNWRFTSALPSGGFVGGVLTATTTMSGKAFNEAKTATITTAATTDIWNTNDGNLGHLNGSATVTSLGTAPQAGLRRVYIADTAFTLTNNANIVVQGAANYTTTTGDRLTFFADTTTVAYATIDKANGAAVAGGTAPVAHVTTQTAGTTFTTNAATKWTRVTVIGGGGGGGGNGSSIAAASGGGGGGVAVKVYTTLAPSTGYTYAVGGAGAAGANTTGGAGGNSTFTDGTTLITGGGGGAGLGGNGTNSANAAGGTATNGDFNIVGSKGAGATATIGGNGGNSGLSYGAGAPATTATASGISGSNYGGGGAGSLALSASAQNGGAGATGAVIFEEWY